MSGKICGVIAAAGLSSRMGAFKPLLPLDGSTVIRCCASHLLAAGAETVVAVTGFRGAEVAAELSPLGVKIVENPDFRTSQMFDSLKLGLAALPPDCGKLLLTPGDVPWVSPALIAELLAAEGDFICPRRGEKRGHPVVIDGKFLPALRAYGGEGGLRGAVAALGMGEVFVDTAEIGVTMDLDTPEDYREMLRLKEKIDSGG